MNIIHRDLTCRNILLGDNKIIKISDFGLSQVLPDNGSAYVLGRDSRKQLPVKRVALESLDNRFSQASDVWMYGVALWEMVTLCTLGEAKTKWSLCGTRVTNMCHELSLLSECKRRQKLRRYILCQCGRDTIVLFVCCRKTKISM